MDEKPDTTALIEELERCRAMLLQSAKLAELGQQVATLVHEMNQPLLGIKAFAQMLQRELDEGSSARRRATFIEEQAVVLEELAGRVRRYTRMETARDDSSLDLARATDGAVKLVGHRLRRVGVTPRVEVPADLPRARLGEVHAQQLLVNLITNAADALEHVEAKDILVRAIARDGAIVLHVADSGSGIDETARAHLFEPFFTTKGADRGTGLGLPICREILKAYGGSIEAHAHPDAERIAGEGMRTVLEVRLLTAE